MATEATGTTTVLTTTPVAVATAGTNEAIVLTNVIAMNTDTESRVVSLYQVPSGGSATSSNLMTTQSVFRNQSTTIPVGAVVVSNGAAIYAECDDTSVVNLSVNFYRTDQQP